MSNPPNDQPEGPNRIDYRETPEITDVHAAVQREKAEPSAEVTPMPLWLTGVCAFATVWAGIYFGIFHGGLDGNVFNEYDSSPAVLFPQPQKSGAKAGPAEAAQSMAQQGKAVFSQCVACHQGTGQGVPGQFPTLVKSDWVVGSEKRLVAILLKGLQGPISVSGAPFTTAQQMPPWEAALSPKKIAAVASYVRNEWGNKAAEISEAQVLAAKKEFASQTTPWTEALLLQIPADATLPDAGGAAAPAPTAGAPASSGAPPKPAEKSTGATASQSPAPAAVATPEMLAEGKASYMGICVACHQPTGMGLPPVFPPLTKSEYVNGSASRFAAMILKGNAPPMTVNGVVYAASPMPGQETALTDKKIAAVMTFVRANFGNSGPPVAPEVVTAARKKYAERKTPWTEAELKAWKDDAESGASAASASPATATPAP